MNAEWVSTTGSFFVVDLLITGVDDGPGVIARITDTISSDLGLDIRSFSITADEGIYKGKVSLLVANKDQLEIVMRKLKKLKKVSTVERVN